MDSPYTEDLKDDVDLTGGGRKNASHMVSADAYAWVFIAGAVVLLWAIGRGFRSVNS